MKETTPSMRGRWDTPLWTSGIPFGGHGAQSKFLVVGTGYVSLQSARASRQTAEGGATLTWSKI